MPEILWTPSDGRVADSLLWRFQQSAPGSPQRYEDLHSWSVEDLPGFWAKVWDDCGIAARRAPDQVMSEPRMPGTRWFAGAELSFAENLLSRGDRTVVVGVAEGRDDVRVSADELRSQVARAQQGLEELGVVAGDRVAAMMPNCPETIVLMLASSALGAVFSTCSPDFGPMGVVDRFGQIEPKVLCTVDGYRYNGRLHRMSEKVDAILPHMGTVEHLVVVDFAGVGLESRGPVVAYAQLMATSATEPDLRGLPFDHPLYVMFSSGTTGVPKSIVHGAGGTLLKHVVEHQLHADIQPGDVVFWFTTCGWMMWNWLASTLASGATIVCYDGSPTYPDLGVLWRMAERLGITHLGTSPRFLAASSTAGAVPSEIADLSALRVLASTGSPLLPEQFDWVYENVKGDVHLANLSGGTDLLGSLAGSVPTLPVRRGELQARHLGMAVEAWDDAGRPVVGEPGELVCTRPFPSMPLGFWGDEDGTRYHDAYFAKYPGVWTHGDLVEIREHGGVVVYGRSDTTLNPGGVRIGTAEIYRAVDPLPEVTDSIVVSRSTGGDTEIVLAVVLADGVALDEPLVARIKQAVRDANTPRHVPSHILAVDQVPYTRSGKKVEKAVTKILAGQHVDNRSALANPEALDEYASLRFEP